MKIILASQSPRRKELLERMGIQDFETISPNVDESAFHGLPPEELVAACPPRRRPLWPERWGRTPSSSPPTRRRPWKGPYWASPPTSWTPSRCSPPSPACATRCTPASPSAGAGEKQTAHEVTDVTFRELSEREI